MKAIKMFSHGNNIFSPYCSDGRPVLICSSCNSYYACPLVSALKAAAIQVTCSFLILVLLKSFACDELVCPSCLLDQVKPNQKVYNDVVLNKCSTNNAEDRLKEKIHCQLYMTIQQIY